MATENEPYKESDDFVPNPTDYAGTLDTSGTAGAAHGRIEAVTNVFDIAKAEDAKTAAKALDPEDDTPSSIVVLPDGPNVTADEIEGAKQRVRDAAEVEVPEIGEPNQFQKEAAEETEPEDAPANVGGGAPEAHANGGGDATVSQGTVDTTNTGAPPEGEQVAKDLDIAEGKSGSDFNPSEHSVAEVLAYVKEHPEEKDAVLAAEAADKDRATIASA